MLLQTLVVGFDVNCYLVGSEEQNRAIVIDPGAEARRIFDVVEESELEIEAIVCTHGHFDHVGGVAELAHLTGADILIHPGDAGYLTDPIRNLSGAFGDPREIDAPYKSLEGDQTLALGEMRLRVLHTPGHTPGSVTVIAGEDVFCGDLIFAGSVGRTDFPGGSWETLEKSIREKIFTLPDNLILHPGHGPTTTIGEEKRYNQFLGGVSAAE